VVAFLERTINLDPGLVSLKSSYYLVTRAGLWAMWASPLDQNSNASIFKVVGFLERTIHLDPGLVSLKSFYELVMGPGCGPFGPACLAKTQMLRSSKWLVFWKELFI